jgi:hypothetical protein
MFAKSLFAAATVAAGLALVPAADANAKTHVDVDLYFGGGWGPGYGYGYGYGYPVVTPKPYYGISCYKGKNIVKWAGFHSVSAMDCGAPVYAYKAWKGGMAYMVRVNINGNITKVKPL